MHHPLSLDRKPDLLARLMAIRKDLDSAGIVMGARCPIALTSRADPVKSPLASAALLALVSAWRTETTAVLA
jgi:phosphate acetyltransferase